MGTEKGSEWVTRVELETEGKYALANRLLVMLAIGGFLLGALFGVLGVVLVFLGVTGNTNLTLFNQTLSTGSVGVASLFIAAVTFVVTATRILAAFRVLFD
jgi:hypothetical protein